MIPAMSRAMRVLRTSTLMRSSGATASNRPRRLAGRPLQCRERDQQSRPDRRHRHHCQRQSGSCIDVDGGRRSGGIPCEDLLSFQARCKSGGGGQKLQAKLTLTDTSHSGEQVTITVDGNPTPVTINGNQAQLSINNPAPGEHTIELTDPAGCFPPRMPSCN